MSTTASLKQFWKNMLACCFSSRPAREGFETTSAPVAMSQDSHRSRSHSHSHARSEHLIPYPFLPIFLFIVVLLISGITNACADYVPEHETPLNHVLSATAMTPQANANEEAGNNNQDTGSDQNRADNQDTSDSQDVTWTKKGYAVPGVGNFRKRAVYTFDGNQLPGGLQPSNYTVTCKAPDSTEIPYNESFDPQNVQVSDGFLTLTVPGGQIPENANDMISCAEVTTVEDKILYGSVRTYCIFSDEPGTCHGMFFYSNDTQETDIEYLTDPTSLSNNGPLLPIPLWYTNQPVTPAGQGKTSGTGAAPTDCTTNIHEYRTDWTKGYTAFYLDGVLQKKYTCNVASTPGPWVWNNWANGDKGWSVGPPANDNVFKIQKIIMYYNTAKK